MTEISRRYFNLKSYREEARLLSNWTSECFISTEINGKLFSRNRFNFTNADDPYFVLDMLELINARLIEENDSALIAVYAVNQKGRSTAIVIRDLELGTTVKLDRGND